MLTSKEPRKPPAVEVLVPFMENRAVSGELNRRTSYPAAGSAAIVAAATATGGTYAGCGLFCTGPEGAKPPAWTGPSIPCPDMGMPLRPMGPSRMPPPRAGDGAVVAAAAGTPMPMPERRMGEAGRRGVRPPWGGDPALGSSCTPRSAGACQAKAYPCTYAC